MADQNQNSYQLQPTPIVNPTNPPQLPLLGQAVPQPKTPDLGPNPGIPAGAGYGGKGTSSMAIADQVLRGWMAGRAMAEKRELDQRATVVKDGNAQVNTLLQRMYAVKQDPQAKWSDIHTAQHDYLEAVNKYTDTLQKYVDEGMKKQKGFFSKMKDVINPKIAGIPQDALDQYKTMAQSMAYSSVHPSMQDQASAAQLPTIKAQAGAQTAQAQNDQKTAQLAQHLQQVQALPDNDPKKQDEIYSTVSQIAALNGKVFDVPAEQAEAKARQAKAALDTQTSQTLQQVSSMAGNAVAKIARNQALLAKGADPKTLEPINPEDHAALQSVGLKMNPENLWDAIMTNVGPGRKYATMDDGINAWVGIQAKIANETKDPNYYNVIRDVVKQANPPQPGETADQYQQRISKVVLDRLAPPSKTTTKAPTQAEVQRAQNDAVNAARSNADPDDRAIFDSMIGTRATAGGGVSTYVLPYDEAMKKYPKKSGTTFGMGGSVDEDQFKKDYSRFVGSVQNAGLTLGQPPEVVQALGSYGAPVPTAPAGGTTPNGPAVKLTPEDEQKIRQYYQQQGAPQGVGMTPTPTGP